MRILLLLSESWNDIVHPNNNLTNWFQGCPDVEIWSISGSSVSPNNLICKHYYLTDEFGMAKSIFTRRTVGKVIDNKILQNLSETPKRVDFHKRLKKIFSSELARLCRDFIWRYGCYNEALLDDFIRRCNPDIIFSQRMGSVKMCRLESIVQKYTDAPFVVYTGDDDFSLIQYNLNPIYWLRRFWVRKWIKRMAPHYKLVYSQSERQMKEYSDNFGVEVKFLVKTGDFDIKKVHSSIGRPIRIIYGGKLYCNRWRTLSLVAKAISKINKTYNDIRVQLHIYTSDSITSRQSNLLNDGSNSIIHGAVSGDELKIIYDQSDLLLHVEGLDKKNRLLTKDSFSTKVMDCLSSGCAVMAIAWDQHAALQYLKKRDAAMTASNYADIEMLILTIVSNPQILLQFAKNAYDCGQNFHNRKDVQEALIHDFKLISKRC